MRVDEANNGTEVDLMVGEVLELELAENPTAGFRWRLRADAAPGCVLNGDGFQAPAAQGAGRPGSHWWKFKAAEPGAWHIQLEYGRSWVSGPGARSFSLTVHVR